ncbi:MAG TPA: Ig-like domain-containing protein [Mycobacteriales bacterium]|nr:Ig-like domain-containing protein [Mycobacteriales bacterium]
MTSQLRISGRRSILGALIAAVLVIASFWLTGAEASATPAGGGSIAGTNGTALSGGNGGCFFAGCGPSTVAGSGGGASSVQTCSATDPTCVDKYYTGEEPRLVVAGGGGGAGGYDGCSGGSGGGGTAPGSYYGNCNGGGGGGNGTGGGGQQLNCTDGTTGGGGATPTAVGTGGAGEAGQENGTDGTGAIGGDGYTSQASNGGGGGGGGGYYGGGGGGATNNCDEFGNGGGAGSSFSVATMTVGNDTTATPGVSLSYGSGPTVQSYNPGPEQTFVVPSGVTSVAVVATGGTGGNNAENDGFGGYGAVVTTTIPVTAGETLYVDVASNGSSAFAAPAPVMSDVSGSATYGGNATLTATLQDDGLGLSGETVDFTLDGNDVGTATTNGSGVASLTGVSIGSSEAGTYPDDVVANFAGDGTYSSATASGDLDVAKAAQQVEFTSIGPTSPGLGDTYVPTATGGGSGNPVTFSIDASTTNNACSINSGTVSFDHAGTCVIDADQTGNADYTDAPTAQQQVSVGKAATSTALSIEPSSLSATVTVPGHSNVTVTGTVEFTVDGNDAGSAALSNGTATLSHSLAPGASYDVAANYLGNGDFDTSTTSAQRTDPTIHATVHSTKPKTAYGWYSTPVTVTFTCTAGSASFSAPCPAAVKLTHSGAGQHVSRTVTDLDGGAATAKVKGINIDRSAPKVTVKGVKNGGVYAGRFNRGRCAGRDKQSGIVKCTLRTKVGRNGVRHYVATAVNRAGLKATIRGKYRLLSIWIPKVRYTQKTGFQLKVGTYHVYAASQSTPHYEWAVPANTKHRPRGGGDAFTQVRPGVWRMTFHINKAMRKRYKLWDIGVRIHGRLHLVRITVR